MSARSTGALLILTSLLGFGGCATQKPVTYQALGGVKSQKVEAAYKEALTDLQESFAMEESDRRDVVAEQMNLNADEGKRFWPLYNAYRSEMGAQGKRLASLIADYAARLGTLQDKDASAMTREYIDIEQRSLDIKKAYLPKFEAILKPKQVARFYQTDQKVDAGVKFGIAEGVPLFE
jgi:hypothetical protein